MSHPHEMADIFARCAAHRLADVVREFIPDAISSVAATVETRTVGTKVGCSVEITIDGRAAVGWSTQVSLTQIAAENDAGREMLMMLLVNSLRFGLMKISTST